MKLRTGFFLVFAGSCAAAMACCVVTLSNSLVAMMDQTNIIVWEADTKTEHFIRNAKFATDAPNLGFIAPTPSIPKMEEVDPAAFETIRRAIVEFQTEARKRLPATLSKSSGSSPRPEVIQVANIAGFKAVTLKASNAQGLAIWMKENGFITTPSIQTWTEFYIKKGWYLTAFKVSTVQGRAETGLVKLSFQTDRPFNPYYVPSYNIGAREPGSMGLLVYFIAAGRYAPIGKPPLYVHSTSPLVGKPATDVIAQLKLKSLPGETTVTTLLDHAFPRSDSKDDVYFERVGPQPQMPPEPPPQSLIYTIMAGAAILIATGYGLFSGKLKRLLAGWVSG